MTKKTLFSFLFFLTLLIGSNQSVAQTGLPNSKIYSSFKKLYVWSIAQDSRGILYVLTDAGLYQYDGVEFTLIGGLNPWNSIAIDSSGIYVAGLDEFVQLESDKSGTIHFKSLLPLFKELGDSLKIGSAWYINCTQRKVYCTTPRYILELDKFSKSTKVYTAEPEQAFYNGFVKDDTYYLSVLGKGLMYLKDGQLKLAPYGDDPQTPFVQKGHFSTGLEWSHGQRVLSFGSTLIKYSWDKARPTPFKLKSDFLSKGVYTVYRSLTVDQNRHVLATLEKGAILIDTLGTVLNYFTDSTALPGNNLISVFKDQNQNIWFGNYQNKWCLTKTEMGLDVSTWDDRVGLKGGVFAMTKYKGQLYASTTQAVYTLNKDGRVKNLLNTGANFKAFAKFKTSSEEKLLVSVMSRNIWDISNGKANEIYKGEEYISQIVQSKVNPDRLLILFENSLGYLQHDHGRWNFHEIDHHIGGTFVLEDNNGIVWVIGYKRISRIEPATLQESFKVKSLLSFTPDDGIPEEFSLPTLYQGQVLLVSMGKGIYCYNEKSKRLEMWQGLGKRFQSIVSQAAMFELNPADNSIYFSTDVARIFNGRIYRTPKGDTIVDYKALKRIPDLNFYPGLAYCVDDDGSVWMGGTRGLAKYNPANDTRNYELDFTCLIRRITYGKDSVLFGGGLAATEIGQRKTNFDYNFNSLTLHYAAPFFDQEEATQYSYRLEGRDKNWSAWSHQPFKEYSDLPEGDYTFSVKAQNVYGKESSIASFSFAVQPPIYRTWWAYLIYISGFMVLIFGVVQWRTRALNKRKKELEELVKVRTNELVSMNQELEASQEELKQNNDELLATNEHLVETQKQLVESEKMASLGQLTAGIAHEINNPINFISGGVQALEILQNELLDGKTLTPDEVQTRQDINDLLKSINNGVSRTADIVKSLKTFSSGSKEFDKQTDVKYAIESAVVLVNSKIIENRISLNKDFQHTSYVTANSPQISQVIINLLDNSIYALRKKTGERIISIRTIEAEKEVIIKVKDNGEGIPDEARNHVFEPFFTTKEVGSGTGLGMSICYSIIKNHKGKISFESSPNEGTEFTIALPKN